MSSNSMNTDYIWIKEHQAHDANVNARNHGQFHVYENIPNSTERLEMTLRSLGRQWDWDLEKYRMSEKTIDAGTKKRFTKNVLRMVKNPIGYTYWRFGARLSNLRFFTLWFGVAMGSYFLYLVNSSYSKQRNSKFMVRLGVVERGTGTQKTGPFEDKLGVQPNTIGLLMNNDLRAKDIVLSQAHKQAYRKHLETRRTYGL